MIQFLDDNFRADKKMLKLIFGDENEDLKEYFKNVSSSNALNVMSLNGFLFVVGLYLLVTKCSMEMIPFYIPLVMISTAVGFVYVYLWFITSYPNFRFIHFMLMVIMGLSIGLGGITFLLYFLTLFFSLAEKLCIF